MDGSELTATADRDKLTESPHPPEASDSSNKTVVVLDCANHVTYALMKYICNGNINYWHSHYDQPLMNTLCTSSEMISEGLSLLMSMTPRSNTSSMTGASGRSVVI